MKRPVSIDLVIAGRDAAGVVECKAGSHEGDGDRVNADIDPSAVSDTEVEIEHQAEQQAPSSHGSLAAAEAWVVEGRPRVVDDQTLGPVADGVSLVDDSATEGDKADTTGDEDGVAKNFKMEPVFGIPEGGVGRFKGEQSAPRDVVGWVGHAEHVEGGKDQSPNTEEDQCRSINGHFAVQDVAGIVLAHELADWRTAFKHTERTNPWR